MRGIVQYEVFVLDEGRWTLCARFPGAQREDAVKEASSTESTTGRPTKVVRDTYFPDTNRNEEITTYISPKGRALQAMVSRRKALTTVTRRDKEPYSQSAKRGTAPQRPARSHRASRAETTIRIVVAIGASVLFATVVTALVSSIFSQLTTLMSAMPAGAATTVMAVTYLVVFLFTFPRAFRSRSRVHQLLLEMWESSGKPVAPQRPKEKAQRRRTADGFRPWDVIRSEVNPPIPPVLEPPTPPTPQPIPTPPASVPVPVQEALPPAKPPEPVPAAKTQPPEAEKPKTAESAPVSATATRDWTLERIILRRFTLDVVMPAMTRSHRDDPVTRRGVAIILSGAVQGLGDTAAVDAAATTTLLTEALTQMGNKPATIDLFLASYATHIAAPNAQPLLAAGKVAIKRYAEGKSDLEQILVDALAVWRFPNMARTLQPQVSVYLLTEGRVPADKGVDEDEEAPAVDVALHDATARMAILERGGEIIPHHGGPGIFARFTDEPTAVAAADAIRVGVATIGGPPVAAVVIKRTHPLYEDDNTLRAHEQARARLDLATTDETLRDDPPFESSNPAPTAAAPAPGATAPAASPPPRSP
ncbi:MAG: hypothetical protein EPO08_15855 [Rhodospirillaceae bacterium]|nr:MAG: hypothetical protein EPO08_15855 [Rhodospirillaceae bacterium]